MTVRRMSRMLKRALFNAYHEYYAALFVVVIVSALFLAESLLVKHVPIEDLLL